MDYPVNLKTSNNYEHPSGEAVNSQPEPKRHQLMSTASALNIARQSRPTTLSSVLRKDLPDFNMYKQVCSTPVWYEPH